MALVMVPQFSRCATPLCVGLHPCHDLYTGLQRYKSDAVQAHANQSRASPRGVWSPLHLPSRVRGCAQGQLRVHRPVCIHTLYEGLHR